MGVLGWEHWYGNIGMGTLGWEHWYGSIGMGTLRWEHWDGSKGMYVYEPVLILWFSRAWLSYLGRGHHVWSMVVPRAWLCL